MGSSRPSRLVKWKNDALMIFAMNQPERIDQLTAMRWELLVCIFNQLTDKVVSTNVSPLDWSHLDSHMNREAVTV